MISINDALESAERCLLVGQPRKAQEICQLIFGIQRSSLEARYVFGRALFAQDRRSEALEVFETLLHFAPVCRWHVVQATMAMRNAKTYLEIGVDKGENLLRVQSPVRIGVDPVAASPLVKEAMRCGAASYFEMTSDEFFCSSPPEIGSGIDVAFIDGLHTYRQALKDVENCLAHLNPEGVILLHDCNPPSEAIAAPASSAEEITGPKGLGCNGLWTGDVWKTIVHLRSCRSDLRVAVADCDFGVGIVFRGKSETMLPYEPKDVERMAYCDFEKHRSQFLDLFPPRELTARLSSRR